MSILLINPSGGYHHEYPPLGPLYIASYLRSYGRHVHFFDEGTLAQPGDEFIGMLQDTCPAYVGLTLYTTNISRAYEIIRRIHDVAPDAVIIVGGPHATALPEYTMQECPLIDFLAAGEGEVTLRELLENLDAGQDGTRVKGLYVRRRDEASDFVFTGARDFIAELDELPIPAHDLVCLDSYQKNPLSLGKRVGVIITSRGCPYNCTFCNKAVFRSTTRRRSPQNVITEIWYLIDTIQVAEIYFQDDLFALDRRWLAEFTRLLKQHEISIPWRMLARVDILTDNDYKLLKEAGCYLIQFGVESGNDQILKEINKQITTQQIIEAFAMARRHHLQTFGFFIFGHRHDNYETINQTLELAKKIRCDFTSFFLLVPFPGTQVYSYLPEEVKYDWKRIQYVSWNKDLEPLSICAINGYELKQFEDQVNMEYYGNFGYLWHNLLSSFNTRLIRLKFHWYFFMNVRKLLFLGRGQTRIFKDICRNDITLTNNNL
jgi:anaerobic magnesium-protoporphyrin IX monomethyl ester cyclase